jgi:hypothetical protein
VSLAPDYVELDALQATLSVEGALFLEADLRVAISAASRAVDKATYRSFGQTEDAFAERFYTPVASSVLEIDDLLELTMVELDLNGDGEFETQLEANVDFYLEPLNALAKSEPYERLRLNRRRRPCWPRVPRSVRVMGQFGWPEVPPGVVEATGILAARLVRRARETPYAIATVGIETGTALRIIRTDPDVAGLLDGLPREVVLA